MHVLGSCKFKCFVFPSSFRAFAFQLKISEICTLFRPMRLQIFCILTIKQSIKLYGFKGVILRLFNVIGKEGEVK